MNIVVNDSREMEFYQMSNLSYTYTILKEDLFTSDFTRADDNKSAFTSAK